MTTIKRKNPDTLPNTDLPEVFRVVAGHIAYVRNSEARGALRLGTGNDPETEAKRNVYTHSMATFGYFTGLLADYFETLEGFDRKAFEERARKVQ